MNFFGHAVVASWASSEPAFAFGAMLPDFAHMVGCRRVQSTDEVVSSGIAQHHQCDEVFHSTHTFLRLQSQARTLLREAGLARGPRLAVAHIGVELMLDSELSRSADVIESYKRALSSGLLLRGSVNLASAQASAENAEWHQEHTDPLGHLLEVLLERVDRLAPKTPDELFERLQRILSRRPRVALAAADLPPIRAWSEAEWPELTASVPAWLREISAGLSLGEPAPKTGASRLVAPGLEPRRG